MTGQTSFGQWLKQRRKTLDLTREELARRVGCSTETIYKIEANARRPSKQIAELLAVHLNIPPDEQPAFVIFARSGTLDSPTAIPWNTPFHPPSNLRALPIPLIGREEEVLALQKRLSQKETRLLTLVGPPGIGKTSLAIQTATQMMDDFTDGVFFVALASVSDPILVTATIANTLGIPDMGPRTPLERLKTFLRDKQILLVLDNFEQILAAAPEIAELLSGCLWLKLLVTSRAPLRIRQERQIPVLPLHVPDPAHLPSMDALANYAAVALFLERAQAVNPDFTLTESNAHTIAAICSRLDGLPLALELISARTKLLPPSALLERLGGRLLLQSDGLRDLEPRQRTLNAAIDWSYQLLGADEQKLFRRLGVFVGGWTLEAAETVCAENLKLNILDGLGLLLDKSLIKQEIGNDGEPRFTMLETIHEYALEQLTTSGELAFLQRQHARYFMTLAEASDSALTGAKQGLWWDQLEIEHANLRAALAWSRTEADGEIALRLALALVIFWRARGYLSEGRDWLTELVERHQDVRPHREAVSLLRARAFDWLGVFNVHMGNLDAAQAPFEASLALFRQLEDTAGIAEVLGDYGMLLEMRGDYQSANDFIQESLTLAREIGRMSLIRGSLFFLGTLAYIQGNVQQAQAFCEESLRLMREAGDLWGIAANLICLAVAALDQEDYQQADTLLRESLILTRDIRDSSQIVHILEVFARMQAVRAQHTENSQPLLLRSARIFGAAEALRETVGSQRDAFERHSYEQGLAALHSQLNAAALATAWAEGQAMTLAQAVAYALEDANTSLE